MSSNWSRSIGRAFALRLGLWYAVLFIASAIALSGATYVLLARALAAQDHDALASMLSRYTLEYQRQGLNGLQNMITADAGQGRHERLLVRVVNRRTDVVYFAAPPGWGGFDLSPLDQPAVRRSGWATIASPPDRAELEVGTVTLSDGVIVQVGRSSHVRDELLANFRARGLQVLALIALAAVVGGFLLTRAGLAPLRDLETTVRSILQTGQFDARVPIRHSRDPLDDLGARVNEMLGRIQSLVLGMRGALDNVAHDLRTPLTRFRNVAETALVAGDADAARDALAHALEEADRVSASQISHDCLQPSVRAGGRILNRQGNNLSACFEDRAITSQPVIELSIGNFNDAHAEPMQSLNGSIFGTRIDRKHFVGKGRLLRDQAREDFLKERASIPSWNEHRNSWSLLGRCDRHRLRLVFRSERSAFFASDSHETVRTASRDASSEVGPACAERGPFWERFGSAPCLQPSHISS
jgi:signal transduction histidine kinase